jgi:hypothetical protein
VAPYELPYGSSVYVRVTATNLYGTSAYQEGNGAIILTVPTAPIVTNDEANTGSNQITIKWPASQENGGTPIIGYSIEYALVGDDYEILADGVTDTFYTALAVTPGENYKFIVRARNNEGYGPYSTEVVILAAQIPDTVPLPSVVFAPDTITITWQSVYDRGSPLLGYKVLILANDGTYKED